MRDLVAQLGVPGTAVVLGLLVLSLTFHEAAHAWAAYKLGDPTAKRLGRLTLNPLPHIDPFMTLILPAIMVFTTGFLFGGAKPVPVDPRNFRHPHRSNALVALAGPLSNILLATLGLVVLHVLEITGSFQGKLLPVILAYSVYFNLLLAVFNALPVPPLDGSRVVSWLLPSSLRASYNALENIGILLIFAMILFVPGATQWIGSAVHGLYRVLDQAVRLGGLW